MTEPARKMQQPPAAPPHPGFAGNLLERLPAVRGKISENARLSHLTWFRTGGPAEVLFRPADRDDLAQFLAGCPADVPLTVIGAGSNLIIRDGGVPGVVIRLGQGFTDIDIDAGARKVTAGAAALDMNVAQAAADAGIAGLEFLSGIPGTIGGAIRMNAGSYGSETVDVLVEAEALNREGVVFRLQPREMNMSYRHNDIPENFIFTGCTLQGALGDPAVIHARIAEIKAARAQSQPVTARTGGSTFANPDAAESGGRKAWQLIDAAGARGLQIGGAQMSPMHCNFMINTGDATSADLETLGETVRRRVHDTSGIWLRWEIRRIGIPLDGAPDLVHTEPLGKA